MELFNFLLPIFWWLTDAIAKLEGRTWYTASWSTCELEMDFLFISRDGFDMWVVWKSNCSFGKALWNINGGARSLVMWNDSRSRSVLDHEIIYFLSCSSCVLTPWVVWEKVNMHVWVWNDLMTKKGRETWLIGIRTIWKLLVAWMLTVVMKPHKMSEDPHPYISRLTSHANWISSKLLYMYVCYILTS